MEADKDQNVASVDGTKTKAAARKGATKKQAKGAPQKSTAKTAIAKPTNVLAALTEKYKTGGDRETLEVITARIPRPLYDALRSQASSLNISNGQLVRDILEMTLLPR